ncbi:kinase-like domain-containing protein [Protomyces lactucae-debilis]|uniref:non-specific serine/threonine protein kinase n=1 Tax=Protomyces lactucae-debilis TaxID=2754530 RepID=A0A1Y2FF01_PROLT|nr:kinase-like domain-containing protein [Protomyces lactucae-debilis]ORY82491.1 kinase-like domain-containing protein [Protomyces lactucae-debilis]
MTAGEAIQGGFAVPAAAISANSKRPMGRPLKDWQLSDVAVVATLDGSLHAVDRATGETRWKIDSANGAIKSAYPNQTSNSLLNDDRETWILEPIEDGGLYVFSTANGLQKLPFGIKQLVENSPFTIPGDDKVYVGERKTTLYSIDPSNGNILQAYGTDFSQTAARSPKCAPRDGLDELDDDDECRLIDPNARNVLKIGRNTYSLTIFRGAEVIWNMTYAEWIPNTVDRDLGRQYSTTFDGLYISPLHDGRVIAHQTETNDALWYREMSTPVVRVYDVLHQHERSRGFTGELTGVAVVTQPLDPHFHEADHENYVDGDGATFVGVTNEGDWFALSAAKSPLVKSAAPSKWSEGAGKGCYDDLVGVHSHNKVSRQEMKVPGQMLTIDGTAPDQQRLIGDGQTTLQTSLPGKSASVLIGILSSLLMIALGLLYTRSSSNKLASLPPFNLATRAPPELNTPRAQVHFADQVTVQDDNRAPMHAIDQVAPSPDEVEVAVVNDDSSEATTSPPDTQLRETSPNKTNEQVETPVKPRRKRGSRGGKKGKTQTQSTANSDNDDETLQKSDKVIQSISMQPMVAVDGVLTIGALQVTEKILGYGSHGTIVYKGSFEGRDVAVKRMLLDFYDIASHEVALLQESDDHPNVIRYYCKQQNERFLYIALELCAASLSEVTEKPTEFQALADCMHDLVSVLRQMVLGIQYLHSLKIVHRDLKPQNILVNMPRKSVVPQKNDDRCARLVISDFGLCKKLDADQSSFRATTAQAAGTSGWRAPELLTDDVSELGPRDSSTSGSTMNGTGQPRKVSRAIDIFSLGCVFYYVLSGGAHPFGDRYMREANIIRNRANLAHLDLLGDLGFLAKDLIARMILPNPRDRPDAATVLQHPFFWSAERRLNFLLDVSDRFELEERDPPSPLLLLLEAPAQQVVGDNWASKLDRHFLENLGKYRKYKGHSIMDLLRAMRNKKHHYQDLPEQVQQALGPLPQGFLTYFMSRFPLLLLHAYYLVKEHLHEEALFTSYFH